MSQSSPSFSLPQKNQNSTTKYFWVDAVTKIFPQFDSTHSHAYTEHNSHAVDLYWRIKKPWASPNIYYKRKSLHAHNDPDNSVHKLNKCMCTDWFFVVVALLWLYNFWRDFLNYRALWKIIHCFIFILVIWVFLVGNSILLINFDPKSALNIHKNLIHHTQ